MSAQIVTKAPLAAAVFFAAFAIIGHAGVQLWIAQDAAALRWEEARAERVLRAIGVNDLERAAANLRLLADVGLISVAAGPLAAFVEDRMTMPAMDDYDLNGNGRIDDGREAEIFLLHANAPEIRLFDEDMDGEVDLPEMARHLDYMTDAGTSASDRL